MKHLHAITVTILFIFLCFPAFVLAAEKCSMLGGTCRDACGPNETAESGAFLDCEDTQECCVKEAAAPSPVKCCVHSFDSRNAGPANCSVPVKGACPKGVGSPVPCAKLPYCT